MADLKDQQAFVPESKKTYPDMEEDMDRAEETELMAAPEALLISYDPDKQCERLTRRPWS